MPISDANGSTALVVQVLVRLRLVEAVFEREAQGNLGVFLVDRDGRLLWSEGADGPTRAAIAGSNLVRDFARKPLHLTAEYTVPTDSGKVEMLGQVRRTVTRAAGDNMDGNHTALFKPLPHTDGWRVRHKVQA